LPATVVGVGEHGARPEIPVTWDAASEGASGRAGTTAPLDILVNNVGTVTPRLTGFLDVTDEQWLNSLTLNLMAAVRTTRAVLPTMLAAGHGNIVTVSSVNAFLPDPAVIDGGLIKTL
jgi:short-subunit dehydrogenase